MHSRGGSILWKGRAGFSDHSPISTASLSYALDISRYWLGRIKRDSEVSMVSIRQKVVLLTEAQNLFFTMPTSVCLEPPSLLLHHSQHTASVWRSKIDVSPVWPAGRVERGEGGSCAPAWPSSGHCRNTLNDLSQKTQMCLSSHDVKFMPTIIIISF